MVTGEAAATTVLEVVGPEAEDSEDTESRRTSTCRDGVGFAYLKRRWRADPLAKDRCY